MTTISRRTFLESGAAAGLSSLAGGLGSPRRVSAQPLTVTLAFWNSAHPDRYAKGTGAYEKAFGNRAKVRYVQLQSGAQAVNLFASGDLDLCFTGSSPAIVGFAKGVPISMIFIASVVTEVEALVVRGVDSLGQLRGKKIGTPFNSSAHFALLVALESVKIAPGEVSILNMTGPQINAAWQTGAIDGAYIWMPIQTEMVATGGKVIFTSRQLASLGKALFNGFLVREEFKKKYPELVLAYLQEVNRAMTMYREHLDQVVPRMARIMSLSEDKVRAYTSALTLLTPREMASRNWMGMPGDTNTGVLDSLMASAQFLKAQGGLDKVPESFVSFVDQSFLAKLL